jgi:hypothetical protein
MPWVGFEPTVPASTRLNTIYALDRSVTLTVLPEFTEYKNETYLQLFLRMNSLLDFEVGSAVRLKMYPASYYSLTYSKLSCDYVVLSLSSRSCTLWEYVNRIGVWLE